MEGEEDGEEKVQSEWRGSQLRLRLRSLSRQGRGSQASAVLCSGWLVGSLPRDNSHPRGSTWGPDEWMKAQPLGTKYLHAFNWGSSMILAYVTREVFPQARSAASLHHLAPSRSVYPPLPPLSFWFPFTPLPCTPPLPSPPVQSNRLPSLPSPHLPYPAHPTLPSPCLAPGLIFCPLPSNPLDFSPLPSPSSLL